VIFFDKQKAVDANHWQWDTEKPSALTVADFTKKLRYNSPNMGEKTWACVHPKREA
jgi:hypothetical protein